HPPHYVSFPTRRSSDLADTGRAVEPLVPVLLDRDDMLLYAEPDEQDVDPASPKRFLQQLTETLEQTNRPDERDTARQALLAAWPDRKSTRLNSSHRTTS